MGVFILSVLIIVWSVVSIITSVYIIDNETIKKKHYIFIAIGLPWFVVVYLLILFADWFEGFIE